MLVRQFLRRSQRQPVLRISPQTQARRPLKRGTGVRVRLDDTETRLDALEKMLAAATAAPASMVPPLTPALTETLTVIADNLKRIADHFNPAPADIVDSPHVARLLDCTTTWIADMARQGGIPGSSIVPGSGTGKPRKFSRGSLKCHSAASSASSRLTTAANHEPPITTR